MGSVQVGDVTLHSVAGSERLNERHRVRNLEGDDAEGRRREDPPRQDAGLRQRSQDRVQQRPHPSGKRRCVDDREGRAAGGQQDADDRQND